MFSFVLYLILHFTVGIGNEETGNSSDIYDNKRRHTTPRAGADPRMVRIGTAPPPSFDR